MPLKGASHALGRMIGKRGVSMMNVVSSVAVRCVLDVVADDDDDTAAAEEEEDDNVEASPPRAAAVTTAALLTCAARSLSTAYPCACTFDNLRLLR